MRSFVRWLLPLFATSWVGEVTEIPPRIVDEFTDLELNFAEINGTLAIASEVIYEMDCSSRCKG